MSTYFQKYLRNSYFFITFANDKIISKTSITNYNEHETFKIDFHFMLVNDYVDNAFNINGSQKEWW